MKTNNKLLSILLALAVTISALLVTVPSAAAESNAAGYTLPDGVTLAANKVYFDTNGTGWTMGAQDNVGFYFYGGDFGTEANPVTEPTWGSKRLTGTAVAGANGIFEFDPAAKAGYTFTPGVEYGVVFVKVNRSKWMEQTIPLRFTVDCFGHVAYATGETVQAAWNPDVSDYVAYWDTDDTTAKSDGGEQTICGDADGNGTVNIADVTAVQRRLGGLVSNPDTITVIERNGDVNGNGRLEISDATWMQCWPAKIEIPYAIG